MYKFQCYFVVLYTNENHQIVFVSHPNMHKNKFKMANNVKKSSYLRSGLIANKFYTMMHIDPLMCAFSLKIKFWATLCKAVRSMLSDCCLSVCLSSL